MSLLESLNQHHQAPLQLGAQEWWLYTKSMDHTEGWWTCKNQMLLWREKFITLHPHSIKCPLSQPQLRRQSWMHGIGYHSLPCSPATWDSTTFITEWGWYQYFRVPQGFHASGDGYTRGVDAITADTFWKIHSTDNTFLWDESM